MSTPPKTENPLFFLDYDGTLAPIVDDPMQAYPHPDVPDLLGTLGDRFPLYIVTGRYLMDLQKVFGGSFDAIGLHGIQRGRLGGRYTNTLPEDARSAIQRYRKTLPSFPGLRVEEKGPTFALHYRHVDDKSAAQDAIREWLNDVPNSLHPIWGKDVLELRPVGISKGTAVRETVRKHPDHTPVYLGDDVTDEDAFLELGDDAVTVKVGTGETAARYRLDGVEDVVEYLRGYTR